MTSRHAVPTAAGAVLLSSLAFVPAAAQTSSSTASQIGKQSAAQVTLVGCLQREADYRRAHDLGKGGAAGTGLGSGDEYMLVHASRAEGSAAAAPTADCTSQGSGDTYELTGSREHDLRSLVGHVVQINGTMKDAKTEVGTTGTARPTGGFDPLGKDLKLFEVNVASFQEVTPPASASTTTPAPATSPAPSDSRTPAPRPAGTSGQASNLPRTASPLPLIGLIGLLSLTAAIGLHRLTIDG